MTAWGPLSVSPRVTVSLSHYVSLCPVCLLVTGSVMCLCVTVICLYLALSSVSMSLCLSLFLSVSVSLCCHLCHCMSQPPSLCPISLWFSASLLLPITTEHPHPRMGRRGTPEKRKGLFPTFVRRGFSRCPAPPSSIICHSRGTQERAGFSWSWVGAMEEGGKRRRRKGREVCWGGKTDSDLGLGARPPACWGTSPTAPAAAELVPGPSSPPAPPLLSSLRFLCLSVTS